MICSFLSALFNPLSAGIFTVFGLIRGQSVTQGSMGCDPPKYPPWGPGLKISMNSIVTNGT